MVGEGTVGGMMKTSAPGVPTAWLPYALVDDVEVATRKAKSLGATVMKDVTEVPDAGVFYRPRSDWRRYRSLAAKRKMGR